MKGQHCLVFSSVALNSGFVMSYKFQETRLTQGLKSPTKTKTFQIHITYDCCMLPVGPSTQALQFWQV